MHDDNSPNILYHGSEYPLKYKKYRSHKELTVFFIPMIDKPLDVLF